MDGVILAVVVDQVVRWSLFPHVMDDHFGCVLVRSNYEGVVDED